MVQLVLVDKYKVMTFLGPGSCDLAIYSPTTYYVLVL